MNDEELRARVGELAPWHCDVELRPGVRTGVGQAAHRAGFVDLSAFELGLSRYVDAKSIRSAVDVGGNAGYRLWSTWRHCGGLNLATLVEPRGHWTDQAELLREELGIFRRRDRAVYIKRTDVTTWLAGLYHEEKFDFVIFSGLLYHLANPLHVLRELGKRAGQVLALSTVADPSVGRNAWRLYTEPTTILHGQDGVAFWPGGAEAITPILRSVGFTDFHIDEFELDDENGKTRLTIWATKE